MVCSIATALDDHIEDLAKKTPSFPMKLKCTDVSSENLIEIFSLGVFSFPLFLT